MKSDRSSSAMNIVMFGPAITRGEANALGMDFDPNSPYSGCRLCGALFQSHLDRSPVKSLEQEIQAVTWRREWTLKHAKTHPTHEHVALEKSGMWATPDATVRLASVGVVPVSDIIISKDGNEQAGLEAPRVPTHDSEGLQKGNSSAVL